MFDIGFWELTMLAVIALLVIGPERLPKVVHAAGLWFGQARRVLANLKAEIDIEAKAEEFKKSLEEEVPAAEVDEIIGETQAALDELKQTEEELSEEIGPQGSSHTGPDDSRRSDDG